ncbi:MAG: hypothetical protein IKS05_07540 [Oscillospiraceae bacterium]|nr:hypothetical protein [Oscillospiraceae bacterium]
MKYPNALRGIKTIHIAELCTLVLTVVSLGMLILEQLVESHQAILGTYYGIVAALSLAALVLELVGIFTASKDESRFKNAAIGMSLSLLLSFGVLFIEEGQLLRTLIELLCIVPTLYCSVSVILGIMHLADKLQDQGMLARKRFLIRSVSLLSVGAVGLEFIAALFLHREKYETLHAIFHTMILTMELVEVSIFLSCTSQAELMLHHAHTESH